MKSVLVGAVEGTETALRVMCAEGHAPAMLVTLTEELASRHSDFVDLAPLARQNGVAVHRTRNSNDPDTLAAIAATEPDVIFVIGWSQLCGAAFRAIPRLGCIGFHPSALPKLRGRGVVAWTVILGETQSGASLFWLADGADTGDIAAQSVFPIDPEHETARSLYDRHLTEMAALLPGLLAQLAAGEVPRTPQDHSTATVCAKRTPEDGAIDWSAPAAEIHRLIRGAGPPYPGAFSHDAGGQKIALTTATLRPDDGYYIGLPGQVQAVADTAFTVMCGDNRCIEVTAWSGPDTPPKLHSKLRTL